MSIYIIISWVLVAILTAINIVVFLKLKGASEQMMKMAFPNAKNMGDALNQMQTMMSRARGGRPMPGGPGGDAQLRSAMEMLKQMKKGGKR